MNKDAVNAAREIATAIRDAEDAAELALVKIAHISHVMAQKRRELGVGLKVGRDPMMIINQAHASMLAAAGTIVDAHDALEPVVAEFGLTRLYGKENPPMMQLQIVSEAA